MDEFSRTTAYGTQHGLVTDAAKLRERQRATDLATQAALAQLAAQERMHGVSDATQRHGIDTQAGVAGKFTDRAVHESSLLDKQNASALDLQKLQGQTQLDVAGKQFGASNKLADLEQTRYNDEALLKNAARQKALALIKGGGMGGAGNQDHLNELAAVGALINGGQMPDFSGQAVQRQLQQMQLDETRRTQAKGRVDELRQAGDFAGAKAAAAEGGVAMPRSGVTSEAVKTLIGNKLPGFVDKDTSNWLSSGIRSAASGAVGGAAVGAAGLGTLGAVGGPGTWGAGALVGGGLGGAVGGVGGFLKGALFDGWDEPGEQESGELKQLFAQLVEALTYENGGNVEVAKQQAIAIMEEQAKKSGQGDDALTDWGADETEALFNHFRQ